MEMMKPKTKVPRNLGKSSTLEILGLHPGAKVRRKWAEHQRRLTSLREEFLRGKNAQSASAKEQLATSSEHIADGATDSYDRDCALALLSSTQNALYEIDQALNRIVEGTYGICELTGQAIEPERLKAIPWTRFCTTAQARLEARGAGNAKVQLGQLGTCLKLSDAEAVAEEESEENTPQREAA